jgi:hypothetical protein
MNNSQSSGRNFESIAWGAFFIWWGITSLFRFLPEGTGAVGIGLIFLGLNAARALNHLRTSSFTITLGVLALLLGGLELARPILHLPFDLPIFAILLILLGVIALVNALVRVEKNDRAG